jgi:hypothetical protein
MEKIMSYEGYEQHICAKGHRFDCDVWSADKTCHCGAESVFQNDVDQTNDEEYGVILPEGWASLQLTEEAQVQCDLGHMHVMKEGTYRAPTLNECKRLRHYKEVYGEYKRIYSGA